jgi:hypothetical protein
VLFKLVDKIVITVNRRIIGILGSIIVVVDFVVSFIVVSIVKLTGLGIIAISL